MARKKANIHYIYKTTCNVTGKWYIGMHSTTRLEDGYMGSGKILRYSIRKHGPENHTKDILEFHETREELIFREREIITKELISDGKCMNLKEGGNGGFSSEEHMNKCSKAGVDGRLEKLKNDSNFKENMFKISSEAQKKKYIMGVLSGFNGGSRFESKHSDETKQLMSEVKKGTGTGETNSQFGTCWITKEGINKKIKKEDLETYINNGWVRGRK